MQEGTHNKLQAIMNFCLFFKGISLKAKKSFGKKKLIMLVSKRLFSIQS
jgi:hypothetical protein